MSRSTEAEVLFAVRTSPRPICKTDLLRRTRRLGIHTLDVRLQTLLSKGLIRELRREAARDLGADVHHKVPSTLFYVREGSGEHQCHFCGEYVTNGWAVQDGQVRRHWLSDCRPDLVEHEPGPACTWWNSSGGRNCYAYQDRSGPMPWPWTDEHKHFDKDGAM